MLSKKLKINFVNGLVFSLAALFCFLPVAAQSPVTKLDFGKPLERQIKGGETQIFQFNVKAGFYARAEVEQKNIDVVVSLYAPDGKLVVEMDGKNGYLWNESLSAIAENVDTTFQVKVLAYGTNEQSGSYTVKLAESRAVNPNDNQNLEAEQHFYRGRKFYLQETPNLNEAAKEYETATTIWHTLGNKYREAVTLWNLAYVYRDLKKNEIALSTMEKASAVFQKVDDHIGQSKAFNGLGLIYSDLGQIEKSAQNYEKSLPIRRELKDKRGEGNTLSNLGLLYQNAKDYEKSILYFEQALSIRHENNDRTSEGYLLNELGFNYRNIYEYDKSNNYYEQAATVWLSLGNYQNETDAINNLGHNSIQTGQNEKAKSYYERALATAKNAKYRAGEADSHLGIGAILVNLGSYEKSIDFYKQSLAIYQELKDKYSEALVLRDLGNVCLLLAQYEKAINYTEQSLTIFREIKNRGDEADALINLGNVYSNLSQYEKAGSFYEQSLLIKQEIKDRRGEGTALGNIGNICIRLSQYEKARDYLERARIIFLETKDPISEGILLVRLGQVYRSLGQYEKALSYFEQSLKISRETKNRRNEGTTLGNLGILYTILAQYEKAIVYHEQSLTIAREIKDRRSEGAALTNLGNDYSYLNEYQKAINYFTQSLSIAKEVNDKDFEATVYQNLMSLWANLNKFPPAIVYGKQAVNAYQEVRSNIKKLDKESQQNYIESKIFTYRNLSDILISEGRFAEAQAVLDLIKEQEYKDISRGGEIADTVPYSKSEAEAVAKIDNLATLGREQTELQKLKKEQGEQFPADKQARLAQIAADIKAANVEFDNALAALSKSDAGVKETVADIQSEKNLQSALQNLGKELNTGAVALYTVIGTEEEKDANGKPLSDKTRSKFGWVILVTPKERKAYPIDVANLEQLVFQFKTALSSDKYDPKPLAQKLYNAIFRQTSDKQKVTLEQDLNDILGKYPDKTLMWSLDGVLRYIPMAALHDGSGYLVEKYRNVLFTKESLLWLMNQPKAKPETLGLGVSAGNKELKMSALPGVDKELSDIIKQGDEKTGILNGSRKLNAQFKKQEILDLKDDDNPFQTVHIASHYSFNPTDQNSSYLLIGDGKMTFGELKSESNLFGTVDLLTLSACDTGVSGNGKEAEGFAYLAQSLGAKSVIASLWEVSDTGTPELMLRFYKLRSERPEMSKGEAFRQAQLSLLNGTAKTDKSEINKTNRAEIISSNPTELKLPLFVKDAQNPFAHPHFWASFVLIGNWR